MPDMDAEKLKRLRDRYTDRGVFDGDDPVLTRAARDVQSPDGKRSLPYSGVPTFLGLPYAGSAAGLDIAAVGVPMDLGVSNRSGARFGPRAVRTIERIGPYHPTFRGVPKSRARAADIGDVPFRSRYSLEQSLEDIERFYTDLTAAKVRPLSVGGDHSITYPILKALGRDAPLGLVHIDAHCDTMGAYDGSKFHHGGSVPAGGAGRGARPGTHHPDRHPRLIQHVLGVLAHLGHDRRLHGRFHGDGRFLPSSKRLVRWSGDQPFYVSVDVDGFDPAYAPGTGTPEAGGLEAREGLALLRGLPGLNIVGADVVEVAPQYDPTTNTSQLAAQILFEEFALMTLGRD